MLKLTTEQEEKFEELSRDRASYDKTLNVALAYHAAVIKRVDAGEKELWDELISTGVISADFRYVINWKNGRPVLKEKE